MAAFRRLLPETLTRGAVVDSLRARGIAYACLWVLLLGLALYTSQPVWMLFAVLAAHQIYRLIRSPAAADSERRDATTTVTGMLDRYQVDGPDDELAYGLFVKVRGRAVFVDLREDYMIDKRIEQAKKLHESTQALDASLDAFLVRNPEFVRRSLASIGLHATNVEQGEVFWDPEGHTLLIGTDFLDP